MRLRAFVPALLAGIAFLSPAFAANLSATPETIRTVLAAAAGGDTIILTGTVPTTLYIERRTFSPSLTIDARAATLAKGVALNQVFGVKLVGGSYSNGCVIPGCSLAAVRIVAGGDIVVSKIKGVGPEESRPGFLGVMPDGYGVSALGAKNIEVLDSTFTGFRVGVLLAKVDGFKVNGNRLTRMRADGIDIAQGWRGEIRGNSCDATRILDAAHPDCIQLWSRPDEPPTSDILVEGNKALGDMQGIIASNHTRLQPVGTLLATGEKLAAARLIDDGGFDRITLRDNILTTAYPNAINAQAVRGGVATGNAAYSVPGSGYQARITLAGTWASCGNSHAGALGQPTWTDKPCLATPTADVTRVASLEAELKAANDTLAQAVANLSAAAADRTELQRALAEARAKVTAALVALN
jgi:hypothetical protein